jgi:hypothetical protein
MTKLAKQPSEATMTDAIFELILYLQDIEYVPFKAYVMR